MPQSFIPVILAGGKGERFWPLSRRQRPKQFLSLDDSGDSLLQSTANRLLPIAKNWNNLWVVTTDSIVKDVKKHLPYMMDSNLLIEPEGKDTAPAVAWAILEIVKSIDLAEERKNLVKSINETKSKVSEERSIKR